MVVINIIVDERVMNEILIIVIVFFFVFLSRQKR